MKKLSKIVVLMLAVVMLLSCISITTSAYSFTGSFSGGIKWSVDMSTKTLTISGSGTVPDYAYSYWSLYKNYVNTVVVSEGITGIGNYAFYAQTYIKYVTLPKSLITIGDYAFAECTNLYNTTFWYNIESIGDYAFLRCYKMIPKCYSSDTSQNADLYSYASGVLKIENLKQVGDYAFAFCSGLTEFVSITSATIGNYAFYCCVSLESYGQIGNSVKNVTVGESAFADCPALAEVIFSKGYYNGYLKCDTLTFGKNAFNGCTALETLSIYSENITLGEGAFSGCTALASPKLDCTALSIGDSTFKGCSALSTIPLKDGLTAIGANAFADCTKLASVTIPKTVTSVGENAFNNCSSCTSLTIAEGAKGFGKYSFAGLAITDVTIPSSVGTVTDYMFANCTKLKTVTVNDGVTTIGDRAFYNCTALTDITLRPSVKNIDTNAFCKYESNVTSKLTGVTIHCEKCSTAEQYAKDNGFKYIADLFLQTGSCGTGLTYTIYSTGLLEISGTGAMSDFSSGLTPWNEYKSKITQVIVNEGVTSIGNNAFNGFSKISSYSLPSTLESIGSYAMEGNYALKSISLPEKLKTICERAFEHCSLQKIVIPDSVTSIGLCAFRCNEWTLTSAKLPANLKIIPSGLFQECYKLADITFPENVETIESNAFLFCRFTSLNIPNTVKSIGASAFRQSQIVNLVIPDSVTYIGDGAFSQNSYLKTVKLSSNLEAIPSTLFNGCTNLTSVEVPSSVKSIGNSAFNGCKNLDSITLPDTYITIGDNVFTGTAIISDSSKRENGVLYIGKYLIDADDTITGECNVKDGTICIYNGAFDSCTKLISVILPESLYAIEKNAFSGCFALTALNIPKATEIIGNAAFFGCSSLENITVSSENTVYDSRDNCNALIKTADNALIIGCKNTVIPATVTSITSRAFYGNKDLTAIEIPEGVTSIGDSAFYDCINLKTVTLPDSLTSIGEKAFGYYKDNSSETATVNKVDGLVIKAHNCSVAKSYADNNGFTFENIYWTVDSGKCGNNLTWTLSEDGCLVISGTGAMYDYYGQSDLPWNKYIMEISSLVVNEGVTTIGNCAFYANYLETVSLPSTLVKIGNYAFIYSLNLTSIKFNEGLVEIGYCAFGHCCNLSQITFPDSLRVINNKAFYDCEDLENVNLPYGIVNMYSDSFEDTPFGNKNLETVDGVTYLGEFVISVDESLTDCKIREGTKVLLSYCMDSLSNLASVELPDSLVTIGNYAFYGCSALKSVKLSDNVTYIGYRAFSCCYSLEELDIGDAVTYIDSLAFETCSSLTSIVIPDTVKYIGNGAFWGCQSLQSVTLSKNITKIAYRTFSECYSLKSLEIPDKVEEIDDYAFCSCCNLESLSLPKNLKIIGEYAFSGCAITVLDIPDSVEKIRSYAFSSCEKLETLNIGSGLTTIDGNIFYGSLVLKDITVNKNNKVYDSRDNCNAVIETASNKLIIAGNKTVIPSTVTSIGNFAFIYLYELTAINIPDSVTQIGYCNFCSCINLKEIYIGSGLNTLLDSSFYDLPSVEKITVSKDNKFFYTQDDCNALILKSNNTLIFGCKNTIIPEGVEAIANYAFYNTVGLTSITIPDSVKTIGYCSFYNCINLKSVTIPDTVTKIEDLAFGYTSKNKLIDSFIIYCYKDSEAEAYAKKFKIDYIAYCKHTDTLTKVDAKAATCTVAGNKEYYICSDCGKLFTDSTASTETTLKAVTLKARSHYWSSGKITTAATCTKAGVKTYTCTRKGCGATKTSTIAATGHNITKVAYKASTCTVAGNNTYYYCTNCNKAYIDSAATRVTTATAQTRKLKAHTLKKYAYKAATCKKAGNEEYYKCTVCTGLFKDSAGTVSTTLDEVNIAALGHSVTKVAYKAATCSSTGHYTYYKCSRCSKVYIDSAATRITTVAEQTIKLKVHKIVKVAYKAPTCTKVGHNAYYKCSVCTKMFSDAAGTTATTFAEQQIKATGHTVTKVAYKAATCTATGHYTYYKCTKCGNVYVDSAAKKLTTVAAQTIAKKAHKVTKVAYVAATCTSTGHYTYYECSVCGKVFVDSDATHVTTVAAQTIKLKAHKLTKVAAKAATATAAGNNAYYICSVCGNCFKDSSASVATTADAEIIKATGK